MRHSTEQVVTIQAYDESADKWNNDHHKDGFFWDDEFEKLRTYSHPFARLLDIGCGGGAAYQTAENATYEYTGIDASSAQIEYAQTTFPRGIFACVGVKHLDSWVPEQYDAFLAIAVLLHFPKQDMAAALANIRHVVTTGGVGLITLKKGVEEKYLQKNGMGNRFFAFYQKEECEKYLREAGFEILQTSEKISDDTTWLCFIVKKR